MSTYNSSSSKLMYLRAGEGGNALIAGEAGIALIATAAIAIFC